jgi:small multidrug resistance family-3 protein
VPGCFCRPLLALCHICLAVALHPTASGRVYATYGAVYIATALGWLCLVDGVVPAWTDTVGVGLALSSAEIIAFKQQNI